MKQSVALFILNSKVETIIRSVEIYSIIGQIYSKIMTKIGKCQAEGMGWVVDSMIEKNINISEYKLLNKWQQLH